MKVVVKTNSPIVSKLNTPTRAQVSGVENTKTEKVVVRTTGSASTSIGGAKKIIATTIGIQGPSGASSANLSLSDLINVDLSNISDGAVLVYSVSSGKWIAQTTLTKQQIDIGDETF